ncbi:MAG: hypothetical protein WC584_05105 [Candidatus Pacearchaeota archaeon]
MSIDKLIRAFTNISRKIKANYIISKYNKERDFISHKGYCPYVNPKKYPIPHAVCNAYIDVL